jgi:hypothetical protein
MSNSDYKYDRCAELGVAPKSVPAVVTIPLADQVEILKVKVKALEETIARLKSRV